MLERLDYIRLEPARVLDAGSGPPRPGLRKRYPRAMAIALDFSLAMLPRPGMLARLAAIGGQPIPGSPAEFGRLIAEETEKWGNVVRAAGIKPE